MSRERREESGAEQSTGTDTEAVDSDTEVVADRPEWEDEYLDRVADRLMFNYDLEKEFAVDGRRFDLYGEMRLESKKHFFHPSISFAHHEAEEHLFVYRTGRVTVAELESLAEFGHRLAEDWVEADEEHYSTDFTFAVVAPELSPPVRSHVESFKDRTLLKFGFYGHYEVNLLVVSPASETVVASPGADIGEAFAVWEPLEPEPEPGLLGLIARRLQI